MKAAASLGERELAAKVLYMRAVRFHFAGVFERQLEEARKTIDLFPDEEIADTLFISTRTVSNHVGSILRKTARATGLQG